MHFETPFIHSVLRNVACQVLFFQKIVIFTPAKNQYFIYRGYDFDKEINFAEFYKLSGDIENQLLMKLTQYKVLIKKKFDKKKLRS